MAAKRKTSKGKKRRSSKRFIKGAIKKPGALRKAAGTTKSGKVNEAKVRKLAKGKGKSAQRARFYLNVLKPASKKRRKKKSRKKS